LICGLAAGSHTWLTISAQARAEAAVAVQGGDDAANGREEAVTVVDRIVVLTRMKKEWIIVMLSDLHIESATEQHSYISDRCLQVNSQAVLYFFFCAGARLADADVVYE
jgi:hypothetical protein